MKRPLQLVATATERAAEFKKLRPAVDLSEFTTRTWFPLVEWILGVDADRLPCVGLLEYYKTDENDKNNQKRHCGYPLDLVQKPVLQFCVYQQQKMKKLFLQIGSIGAGDYVQALDLITRKVYPVNWLELSRTGFSCNYYCEVKRLPWKTVDRHVMHMLRDEYLCMVEYFDVSDAPGLGELLVKGMKCIKQVVQQEYPVVVAEEAEDIKEEEEGCTQLEETVDEKREVLQTKLRTQLIKRVQMGTYTSMRAYYKELFHPGFRSFTNADKWAELGGGVDAAAKCTVTLPVQCIRAITVANIKYIITDFYS